VSRARLTTTLVDQHGQPQQPESVVMPVRVTVGAPLVVRNGSGSEANPFNLTVDGGSGISSFDIRSACAPDCMLLQRAWTIQQSGSGGIRAG
jgi:hypothetical protein